MILESFKDLNVDVASSQICFVKIPWTSSFPHVSVHRKANITEQSRTCMTVELRSNRRYRRASVGRVSLQRNRRPKAFLKRTALRAWAHVCSVTRPVRITFSPCRSIALVFCVQFSSDGLHGLQSVDRHSRESRQGNIRFFNFGIFTFLPVLDHQLCNGWFFHWF